MENESASTVQNQICRRKPSPQKSTVAVNTLSVSKMEQKSLAFLFLSKLPTPYPFPRMSFCSTVLNILLPLQTPNFTACCWTVMKLNRLSSVIIPSTKNSLLSFKSANLNNINATTHIVINKIYPIFILVIYPVYFSLTLKLYKLIDTLYNSAFLIHSVLLYQGFPCQKF